jgi:hypothetical protein
MYISFQSYKALFETTCKSLSHSVNPRTQPESEQFMCQKAIYLRSPMSRDSVVGKATAYGLEDREVGVQVQVG